VRRLIQAGCADITDMIVNDFCSHTPMVRGGVGCVYQGKMRDNMLVAIKCMEVFGEVFLLGGHKSVKVSILSIARIVRFTHLNDLVPQRAAREVYMVQM
jgi:hypothetical protein